ncbi:hypothetical protein O4H66_14865 [Comamonadaceae bacterium G21597-S1]|nr:hypothetical protein [Comamonadaceae bacterium G21597-S1]
MSMNQCTGNAGIHACDIQSGEIGAMPDQLTPAGTEPHRILSRQSHGMQLRLPQVSQVRRQRLFHKECHHE